MIQVCEDITAQAETFYKQKNTKIGHVSERSVDEKVIDEKTLEEHEKKFDEFEGIVKEIQAQHLENQQLWSEFLVQF